MGALLERLQDDLRQAMKARDEVRASVLRMLLARIKERQVAPDTQGPLDDAQIEQILASYAKQRRESAQAFEQAGRQDLRDRELHERDIVMAYLPQQLDDASLHRVLQEIIKEVGAQSPADLGKVMGAAMKRLRGKAEGARVQAAARALLGG